jgi:predicted PurR-regulated permease PerM
MLGICTGVLTFPLFRKLQKIKEKKGDKNFRNIRRIFSCLLYILSIVTIFLLICMIVSVYADLQLNTSFQQRLRVLSPKIGDLETKNLQASWALMESKEDYEKIVRQMEELAKENNIELPKLLID